MSEQAGFYEVWIRTQGENSRFKRYLVVGDSTANTRQKIIEHYDYIGYEPPIIAECRYLGALPVMLIEWASVIHHNFS